MITATRNAKPRGLGLLLLAAFVALATLLGGVGTASAATATAPGNRVGASTPAVATIVGATDGITAGQRLGSAVLQPDSVVATGVAAKGGTPLYRGVTEGHHAFDDALQGTAMPGDLLGHSDGILHSAGMTESSFLTSWTTNRAVAVRFATNGSSGRGVILQTTLEQQAHRTVSGLDLGESEVLLRGMVTGCRVGGCP